MKKIINDPAQYTDDMLKGIYRAHSDQVGYVNNDLRCYCHQEKGPRQGVHHHRRRHRATCPCSWAMVGENLLGRLRRGQRVPVPQCRADF